MKSLQSFIMALTTYVLSICQPVLANPCYNFLRAGYHPGSQAKLSRLMRRETVSERVFDAGADVSAHISQILFEYQLYGQIHITNTGISDRGELLALMPTLGFTDHRKFVLGGRASLGTQKKWVESDVLRNLDYYPPRLYLLPNTEVQYSKVVPKDVLFFVDSPPAAGTGGRVFTHSIREMEDSISAQPGGPELLDKIRAFGLTIVTGYVDDNHPNRKMNFLKSWQELSGRDDIDAAISELSKQKTNYAKVWKKSDPNGRTFTLMTEISITGSHEEFGESYLSLPRIAATGPIFENGFREFLFGNGDRFSRAQINILLQSYLATRQGGVSKKGDLYLIDNVRTAHSRESFDQNNSRSILVGMSGARLDDSLPLDQREELMQQQTLNAQQFVPLWEVAGAPPLRPLTPFAQRFSMQIYDLAGRDLSDLEVQSEIRTEFAKYGHLHIVGNRKYTEALPESILAKLGFESGQGSRSLFFFSQVLGEGNGGRVFAHSYKNIERLLRRSGNTGHQLLTKLKGRGVRDFMLNDNKDLTDEERVLLLQAIDQTREGTYQSMGDIILLDGAKYGHTFEASVLKIPEQ